MIHPRFRAIILASLLLLAGCSAPASNPTATTDTADPPQPETPAASDEPGLVINNSDTAQYRVQVWLVPGPLESVEVTFTNGTTATHALLDEPLPLRKIIHVPNIKTIAPSAQGYRFSTTVAPQETQDYDLNYGVSNTTVIVVISKYTDEQQSVENAMAIRCDSPHPWLTQIRVHMDSQGVGGGRTCD